MATKWKYATVPADTRLEMLRSGNDELYKEEIARTKDAISTRLANGIDVSEQMKWADTVSYNYNLAKAASAGVDSSNVAKEGYAKRLFGDMTGDVVDKTSTVTSKKKTLTSTPYYGSSSSVDSGSLQNTIINSYVSAINQRGKAMQQQANANISAIYDSYEKQIAEAKALYEKKSKNLKEALMNEGTASGGRALSEELKLEDEYRDLLKSLQSERDKLISDIRTSLMGDLNALSGDMMMQASNDYYRYSQLLADQKNAQYQKEKDESADEKWWSEFYYQQAKDKAASEEKQKQRDADYEKWLKELELEKEKTEKDYAIDAGKLALDREKFELTKEADNKDDSDDFGKNYEYCLEYAKRAKNAVVKNKATGGYDPKYTRDELIKLVDGFDLSETEKIRILKSLGF